MEINLYNKASNWEMFKSTDKNDIVPQVGEDCGIHTMFYAELILSGVGQISRDLQKQKRIDISQFLQADFTDTLKVAYNKQNSHNVYKETPKEFIKNSSDVKDDHPNKFISTTNYLKTCIKYTFKATYRTCFLGKQCLKPKNDEMRLCIGCHDWYHNRCIDSHELIIEENDNNSILSCIKCCNLYR